MDSVVRELISSALYLVQKDLGKGCFWSWRLRTQLRLYLHMCMYLFDYIFQPALACSYNMLFRGVLSISLGTRWFRACGRRRYTWSGGFLDGICASSYMQSSTCFVDLMRETMPLEYMMSA